MNILLTGGAGYIGSHVALSLIDKGHSVHIIDNLSTGNPKLIPKKALFTKCNINDDHTVSNIIKNNKYDALMHFAGFVQVEESVKYPNKYFENNTENSIKLFNICKKNGLNKIIFSSTAAAYGSVSENKIIDETTNLNPQNPYAESKIKTENFLFENKDDFKFIILRYFNVAGADKNYKTGQIGKHKPTHVIKNLTDAIIKNKTFEIFGKNYNTKDGSAVRDFIYLEDLSKIHIKILKYMMKKNYTGKIVLNCGYGLGFSILDLALNAKKLYKNFEFKFSQKRKGDLAYVVADNSKLKKILKWNMKITSIKKIIKSSVEWEKRI